MANTRAFNNHFGTANLEYRRGVADAESRKHSRAAQLAFESLTKKALADHRTPNEAESAAHQALQQIPLLKPHCEAKPFDGIDLDGCLTTVKEAEGGEDRTRLAELVHQQAALETVIVDSLTEANYDRLRELAARRDDALSEVGSALLRQHYQIAERVLSEDTWLDKNQCPTCDVLNDNSVLEKVRCDLERYQAVQDISAQISVAWTNGNWTSLIDLENAAREEGEPEQVAEIVSRMQDHSLTAAQVDALSLTPSTVLTWIGIFTRDESEKSRSIAKVML